MASSSGAELGPPRAWALLLWLNKAGAARFRYRLLQGLALSLAVNQCSLLWLGQFAGARAAGQAHLLASTTYWSVGLALVSGWVLLGGWFDDSTRALFGQLATRRGYTASNTRQLESMSSWRWLALLLAFPSVTLAFAATLRMSALSDLGALAVNLSLSLLFTEAAAACVVFAVVALRRFEPRVARRFWLLACFLPEVIRPLLPGFPTLRVLAAATEQIILRWGAGA
jgi:hypothetical protein